MNAPDLTDEIAAIAQAVRRLSPSWQRPELFFEERSEISARLARLARNGAVFDNGRQPARVIIREVERVVIRERIVVLPRHLVRPSRRHRYPRPPLMSAQGKLAL